MGKQRMITYSRTMNGYEFIEFMRKFGWKHNGKYLKPHKDLGGGEYGPGYYRLSGTRRKFEGWEYWFDRPFPTDILHEETEITYAMSASKELTWTFEEVEKILYRNGFSRKSE